MGKWAACRMKFLLWNEKLQRIKALSGSKNLEQVGSSM
jgi:hypothetical protein